MPAASPCCGCICHVCAEGHAAGVHTTTCAEWAFQRHNDPETIEEAP